MIEVLKEVAVDKGQNIGHDCFEKKIGGGPLYLCKVFLTVIVVSELPN